MTLTATGFWLYHILHIPYVHACSHYQGNAFVMFWFNERSGNKGENVAGGGSQERGSDGGHHPPHHVIPTYLPAGEPAPAS